MMRTGKGGRWGPVPAAALAVGLGPLAGCAVLETTSRDYHSNEPVLQAVPDVSGYRVDPERQRLLGADVREDSITYQYGGVEKVGDHAWVVRFSQKSSEQSPDSLMNVAALLPLIAEGRDGFEVVEEGQGTFRKIPVSFVRYRFQSPIRDVEGKPFPAHGIVASLRQPGGSESIVWQMKLDNHGDRDDVVLEDLAPFLEPLTGD